MLIRHLLYRVYSHIRPSKRLVDRQSLHIRHGLNTHRSGNRPHDVRMYKALCLEIRKLRNEAISTGGRLCSGGSLLSDG